MSKTQARTIWAVVIGALLVDLIITARVATITTSRGEGLVNEYSAIFLGIQTATAIVLAGLTARYVVLTRALLEDSQATREAERRAKEREDLDETRRLAYISLLARSTGHVELAASLVNALVHHQGVNLDDALANVPTVLNGGDGDYDAARWMHEQIDRITAELDEG